MNENTFAAMKISQQRAAELTRDVERMRLRSERAAAPAPQRPHGFAVLHALFGRTNRLLGRTNRTRPAPNAVAAH